MQNKSPRINVTLEQENLDFLVGLAKKEHKSLSGLTKELILEALERREDKALSSLAEAREEIKGKRLRHEDVWK